MKTRVMVLLEGGLPTTVNIEDADAMAQYEGMCQDFIYWLETEPPKPEWTQDLGPEWIEPELKPEVGQSYLYKGVAEPYRVLAVFEHEGKTWVTYQYKAYYDSAPWRPDFWKQVG